jgi:hypothetical protein
MRKIKINDEWKPYEGHQIRQVVYDINAKTAKVMVSVIVPDEGAWDYFIERFPYDDPENFDEYLKNFVDEHIYNAVTGEDDEEKRSWWGRFIDLFS